VTATMTWVRFDVHARSTHAAAIDRESGVLTRARFGVGRGEVVAWLAQLLQPIHACYEAGPTGYALYRVCEAAGLHVDVVASSKTPRASGDRVKTDRKDAELLVRLLLAGSLTAVAVPTATVEAAHDFARAGEQARADLARVRQPPRLEAVVRHGRVYERAAAPGRRRTGRGWPGRASQARRPSSPSSTTWPRSTASLPAASSSTNSPAAV
jgi:transposase